jgi:hypothetical protein
MTTSIHGLQGDAIPERWELAGAGHRLNVTNLAAFSD